MNRLKLFALLFSLIVLSNCSSDDESPAPSSLVTYEFYGNFEASTLKVLMDAASIDLDPSLIAYDVEMYRVVYKSTYRGEEIEASGMVAIPLIASSEQAGMISFQHGTMVKHTEAPSQMTSGATVANLYAALASTGFIVPIPDYFGFGASADIPHPYYVEEATADAVTDMLKAAKELSEKLNIKFNGDLFLAGYSQGGYATLAAHKSIEQNGLEGFNLIASFPAAGGYDVKGMQEYFFDLTTYDQPFYIAYVAHAYANHYGWTQPYSLMFNEPYAGLIPTLFDGSKSASEINNALTEEISVLLTNDILVGIDGDEYTYIVDAFVENSLTNWTPTIPIYFYHGDADITVPYQNSIDSYNQLLGNGASEDVISFTTLEGATHSTGIFPYIEEFLPIVLSLQ